MEGDRTEEECVPGPRDRSLVLCPLANKGPAADVLLVMRVSVYVTWVIMARVVHVQLGRPGTGRWGRSE